MVSVRRYGLNWNEYIRTRKYGKPVRRTLISATFIFMWMSAAFILQNFLMKNIQCRIHRTILSVMAVRECLSLRSKCVYEIPVWRTDKNSLGTKGRTSILSVESSASCGASFPVSRRKLLDRECFVTSFRQGGYTPLRRLCGYPLWTCRLQTA